MGELLPNELPLFKELLPNEFELGPPAIPPCHEQVPRPLEFDHVPSLHKLPAKVGVKFAKNNATEMLITVNIFFIKILWLRVYNSILWTRYRI